MNTFKISFAFLLFLTITMRSHGQDLLILGSGQEIQSKVLEVGITDIKYKLFTGLDGSTMSIPNIEVVLIKFENGTSQVITNMTAIQHQENLNASSNVSTKYQNLSPRKPVKAALFSALLTGGGQFYNRQIGKGAIMTSMSAVGWGTFFVGFSNMLAYSVVSVVIDSNDEELKSSENIAYTGLIMVLATKIWSVVDASMMASKINKKYHLSMKMVLDYKPDYFVGTNNLIVGPSVAFHF